VDKIIINKTKNEEFSLGPSGFFLCPLISCFALQQKFWFLETKFFFCLEKQLWFLETNFFLNLN
jgi:hypothetical protein